jgi:hypothetical protein
MEGVKAEHMEIIDYKIKDRKGKVSELPEDHPAIGRKTTPSVTIT